MKNTIKIEDSELTFILVKSLFDYQKTKSEGDVYDLQRYIMLETVRNNIMAEIRSIVNANYEIRVLNSYNDVNNFSHSIFINNNDSNILYIIAIFPDWSSYKIYQESIDAEYLIEIKKCNFI